MDAPVRLTKSDVEGLLDSLDTPQLVTALAAALAKLLRVDRFDDDWPALVRLAGQTARWSEDRVTALVSHEPFALAGLATDLNELRVLA